MTQKIVNIGTSPSNGDGDPLRIAFDSINQNFTELYDFDNNVASIAIISDVITANIGNVVATVVGVTDLSNVTSMTTNATISNVHYYTVDSPVRSVNGKIGDVQLGVADVPGAASISMVSRLLNIITTVPVTSKGSVGHLAGMVAYSDTHFYYCSQDYDGTTDIWHKIANDTSTW